MILITIARKMLVALAPLALLYLLRKVSRKQRLPKRKSHLSGFDKSTIVEGEIVEEKK